MKRCHGDLKCLNIWIANELCGRVQILDAIDFNPDYYNIDVLSDFAMLVVDIQGRMRSTSLANTMIEEYLRLIGQQDESSKFVLTYYLIEKAIVSAIVNIVYDHVLALGLSFLDVTEMRLEELKKLMNT